MEIKKIPLVGWLFDWLEGEGIEYGWIIFIGGVILFIYVLTRIPVPEGAVISLLFATAPLWLPFVTFLIFFSRHMAAVGAKFTYENGRTTVELLLPPEVTKSPEAMEFVFTQIHNVATPDNLMQTYLDGKRPLPYTFELVSRGGDVHFYITLPNKFVPALSANLYAQYPGVEVRTLDLDYTAEVPADLKDWEFMSFHMNKKKDDVYPIKTYIDYELNRNPKEEEKVDPMTPMLEVLGSVKPGDQLWIQFICLAHREKNFKLGSLSSKSTWEVDAASAINKLMGRQDDKTAPPELEGSPRLTNTERDTVDAIGRHTQKYAYETAIRWCYLAPPGNSFDGGLIPRTIRSFAQTEMKCEGRNGIGVRWRTDFNYMFISDPFGTKIPALKRAELKEYKQRILFPKNSGMSFKIYSAEELATLYHVPGKVAMTPTLNRVSSTRAEAPANLPTS